VGRHQAHDVKLGNARRLKKVRRAARRARAKREALRELQRVDHQIEALVGHGWLVSVGWYCDNPACTESHGGAE
jgi:hypothetical protein